MSDEKRNTVCTLDHANKHSDALNSHSYRYWRKVAEQLKASRQELSTRSFRRDQVDRKRG